MTQLLKSTTGTTVLVDSVPPYLGKPEGDDQGMLAMKAMKGAGWLVLSRFVGRAIDFVTLLILARILTPADFGTAALAMSLIAVVDTVLDIPVTQALMRLRDVDKSHLDTGFTLGCLRSAAFAIVILAAALPFSRLYGDAHLVPLLATLAIGPVAKGFYSPNMVHFSRELNFKKTFTAELIAKLAAFTCAVATVLLGGGYWSLVANFVAAAVTNTIASYVLAPYRPAFSLSRYSDFSSFVGWFSGSQIVSALNWQFDRAFLGRFVDKATLGRYALASDLATLPTQSLIGPAMQPLMAAFSKINAEPERLTAAFLKAARLTMLISAPVCIGISLTADLSVNLLLGEKWREAAPLLHVLALATLPGPYLQALFAYCVAVDRPRVLFEVSVINCGLRVLLITAGFYLLSIDGVIAAQEILAAVMFVFYIEYTRRVVGASIASQLKNLWKVAASSAVMAISVLLFRHAVAPLNLSILVELVAAASVGAASYGVALLAFGLRLSLGNGSVELIDRT